MHIIMISEGSCDTEDVEVMMLKIQLCITGINYILQYIHIKSGHMKYINISQYYCVC